MKSTDHSHEFTAEIVVINLQRLWWLLLVGLALISGSIIATRWVEIPGLGRATSVLWIDLGASLVAIGIATWILKHPGRERWREAFVVGMVVAFLLMMNAYYFSLLASSGQNPNYILAVVGAAALFIFPLRIWLSVLVGNHVIYSLLLLSQSWENLPLFAVWIENSTGAALAGLIAAFLFRSRWQEFVHRKVLEERNTQLNELMAITAHDLRSPLCGVRDLVKLANDQPMEKSRQMLGEATQSCEQMLRLVGQLLEAHGAEQQRSLPLTYEDLRDEILAAVQRVRIHAVVRAVQGIADVPGEPAKCRVHLPSLAQVLDNLLGNAIMFSPSSGEVRLQLWAENGQWSCDVLDQGPGVVEEERALLFQKFFRGQNASGVNVAGNGLGLYIVARLMASMNGRVEYLPRAEGGSILRLTFGQS